MKMKCFSFLVVAVTLTLASCSSKTVGSDDAAKRLVAAEAPAFIVSLKLKDLLDKGGISNKENVPMAAQMLLSDQVEYLTNPEKAGLDLSGKSYLAISVEGETHYGWALTKIKDKEALEKTLKDEGHTRFEEIEGYNTIVEDDKILAAWNEKHLILVVSSNGKVKDKFKTYAEAIDSDKTPGNQYNKFFESATDVAFFHDLGRAAELQASMPHEVNREIDMEMVKKVAEKLKGSYSLTTVNFENDKVVADISNDLSENAKKEFNFVGKNGFPKELMAQLGSEEMTGFISLNADVKQLVDWAISFSGKQDMLAEAREKTGLDVDRILGSFKGNVLVAFQGMMKVPFPFYEEGSELDSINRPRVSVIASLNNNYLETIVDSILGKEKEGNFYVVEKGFSPQYLAFKPAVVFYTNDSKTVSGTGAPKLEAKAEEVLNKPFSFYIDLHTFIKNMGDKKEQAARVADKFKYAIGGFDMSGGHAELILNNGGKNSLWTIINLGIESSMEMMPEM